MSEKEKPEQLKKQKDIQETLASKISESANNKNGDNRKFERTYISGFEKPKVYPVTFVSDDNVECIKFDSESAKRKEKIAEITPGWCE
ncbi:27115_t:CDS:2 [Gigaspora margarita]|uniref:27115_t:CDS:1 n=1 Tax=Gigaspora margarita TaxID=4874 RepID=A0ABN7UM53_GIGMA|nr:27115_t:CDS:2 [Gigaspora margarita]